MNIPENLKYTRNDEWLNVDGSIGTIGITDYAQEQLSDIVFMEIIVSTGDQLEKDEQIATIESVKAAADVYSPVSGKVLEVNEALSDDPETLNNDPYGKAWLIKIELTAPEELDALMDSDAYQLKISEKE